MQERCPEAVARFAGACSKLQPRFKELLQKIDAAGAAFASQQGGALQLVEFGRGVAALVADTAAEAALQWGAWARNAVSRKVLIAAVAAGRLGIVDWAAVTMADVKDMVPDQSDVLDCFPASMPASAASDLVLGRRDRAMFLSMWACLFHDKSIAQTDPLLKMLGSPAAEDVVRAYKVQSGGVAPCPAILCARLQEIIDGKPEGDDEIVAGA